MNKLREMQINLLDTKLCTVYLLLTLRLHTISYVSPTVHEPSSAETFSHQRYVSADVDNLAALSFIFIRYNHLT
jgi:hypothetical protein